YFAFSTIRTTRHLFSFEMGRVSMISTLSPTPDSLFWSCALNLVVRRTVLPYSGWRNLGSMATTTVWTILSLMTSPIRVLPRPRPPGAGAGFGPATFFGFGSATGAGAGGFRPRVGFAGASTGAATAGASATGSTVGASATGSGTASATGSGAASATRASSAVG